MAQTYSIIVSLKKAFWAGVLFAIPAAINYFTQLYPQYVSLTLGALLVMAKDYVAHRKV